MALNIGDRVKYKTSLANRLGTITGIYEDDVYIESNGERILFASKGELKIKFDSDTGIGVVPMHRSQLEKI